MGPTHPKCNAPFDLEAPSRKQRTWVDSELHNLRACPVYFLGLESVFTVLCFVLPGHFVRLALVHFLSNLRLVG